MGTQKCEGEEGRRAHVTLGGSQRRADRPSRGAGLAIRSSSEEPEVGRPGKFAEAVCRVRRTEAPFQSGAGGVGMTCRSSLLCPNPSSVSLPLPFPPLLRSPTACPPQPCPSPPYPPGLGNIQKTWIGCWPCYVGSPEYLGRHSLIFPGKSE